MYLIIFKVGNEGRVMINYGEKEVIKKSA